MYRDGNIVTLVASKSHFDGQETLNLNSGTCGMIVQTREIRESAEQSYVVDFGPYGQWNCTETELHGDQSVEENHEEDTVSEEDIEESHIESEDHSIEGEKEISMFEKDLAKRIQELESGKK